MVSQRPLHTPRKEYFSASHLSCASVVVIQYQVTVKLYGVFPSSRGLIRIFTYTTISPGPLLRQCPNRYSIRAGRNLPDKEFRYLRTVIVTALALSQKPVFLINSRLGLFSVTDCSVPLLPKLRGHFAEFLNKGSPVRLRIFFSSTCVGLRYGYLTTFSSFSRRRGFACFPSLVRSPSRLRCLTCVLHYKPPLPLGRAFPSARSDYPSVSLLH